MELLLNMQPPFKPLEIQGIVVKWHDVGTIETINMKPEDSLITHSSCHKYFPTWMKLYFNYERRAIFKVG